MIGERLRQREAQHELVHGVPLARIAAVGDLMLGLGVGKRIGSYGPSRPFRLVKPLLADADLRFANLEWPLTETDRRHPVIGHRPRHAPPDAVEALTDADFTVLSVANNHIFDCLDDGLTDTLALLADRGISWVGAGSTLRAARSPAWREVNGVRLAFLAYTFPVHQIATEEIPGCAPNEPELMVEDVQRLRGRADHVIVSMHTGPDAGNEFCFYPSLTRQVTCHRLLEAGATAVLCHHCHVPQGIEVYNGRLIAHGLGSFITDVHDWFFQSAKPPYIDYVDKAMILYLDLDASRLLSFSLQPTAIGTDLTVRPLEGRDREEFLEFMEAISAPLYDADALERLLPSRSLKAKLVRLAAKAGSNSVRALAAELISDAIGWLDRWLFAPWRVRALRRQLKASRRDIQTDT